jgi:hypothetical protein
VRQLNYIKARTLEWQEVEEPSRPSDQAALLRRTAPGAIVTSTAGAIDAFGDIPFPVTKLVLTAEPSL